MLSEKYRPDRLDGIIGQDEIINSLRKFVAEGDIPHLLFVGKPGTGKTTTAYALARELSIPIQEFNASDERTLEFIRERIKPIAMSKFKQIVLLDEFDSMTEQAQFALRRLMEQSSVVRFILTANNDSKILDAIKSRCAVYRFKPISESKIRELVINVLREEKVKFSSKEEVANVLNAVVNYSEGDMRKVFNFLEQIISGSGINSEFVKTITSPGLIDGIFKQALSGNLTQALVQLEDIYSGVDYSVLINRFYAESKNLDLKFRAVVLMELARAEHAIKMGSNPLVQLSSVVARLFYEAMKG
ncbi:MAG: AAA family ATPase [Metallosphaera sp.]